MPPTVAVFLTIFLAIFHGIGGAAVGAGLRALLDRQPSGAFTVLWGAMFGGIPFLFDLVLLASPLRWLVFVGPAIFLITLLLRAFMWQGLLSEIGVQTLTSIGVGTGCFLLGAVGLYLIGQQGEWLFGIIWGGMFMLGGAVFVLSGLGALLRGHTLDEKP